MSTPVVDAYLDELLCELPAGDAPQEPMVDAGTEAVESPRPPLQVVPPVAPQPPRIDPPAAPAVVPPAIPQAIAPAAAAQAEPRPRAAASSRWLRVGIGSDHYAFELLRVQEVVRVAPIVAMRGAAPSVLGVMNLRGRIVPVFDLGLWLGGAAIVTTEHSRIVVVERDDELIGVLVTVVENVATLSREHVEPPLLGSDAGATVGIARVGNQPTVLLVANALFLS